MEDKPDRRKLAVAELVSKSFGIVMVVLYFVIGTTFIFKAPTQHKIPESYVVAFGILLILYGLYRAYKLYRRYFE